MTEINPDHRRWLIEERRLDPDVVRRMGIYSVARQPDGSAVPDATGRVMAFPFWRDGEEVNTKYRGPQKLFWQRKGGRKVFWNRDCLKDERLASGALPLVICEGEIDAMSLMALVPTVVSVPDGAPPARGADGRLIEVPEGADDIVVGDDTKFEFLHADWDLLAKVKRIIIAVDADEPGQRLAKELVRRLGKPRCEFIEWQGHKDANEVLCHEGLQALSACFYDAKPYPVSGIYGPDDLPPRQPFEYGSTPWGRLDEILKPYCPALTIVTGFANHGKSAWTMQLAAHLIARHDWPTAIASFEMLPEVVLHAMERAAAESIPGPKVDAMRRAHEMMRNRLKFISPDPEQDEVTDVDWLLDRATTCVIRYGIKHLILDPWNEIEHNRRRDESLTEYTGRALRKIHRWRRQMECSVTIVAHPTKSAAAKDPEDLTLYDVSDSAHFANKADVGIVVARLGDVANPQERMTGVYVKKVRYQPETGLLGSVELVFDRDARTFH